MMILFIFSVFKSSLHYEAESKKESLSQPLETGDQFSQVKAKIKKNVKTALIFL